MCGLNVFSPISHVNNRTSTGIGLTIIPESPSGINADIHACVAPLSNLINKDMNKSPGITLKNLRAKNSKRIIIAHLNINFLEKKFEALRSLVEAKVDILIISETKIDASFPLNRFIFKGYSTPFRADRNYQGGVLIIYIREDIPCKELKASNIPGDVEGIFIELIIGGTKWFLMRVTTPKRKESHIS